MASGVTDDNSFSGRVRRYAQVSTAMGGLAARLAGERYLGLNLDRSRHAAELKAALGGIKGPLMKVAQLLATIPDGLPKEYVQELAQLQANAPAMGWPFVRRRMAGELGIDWQTKFRDFEKTAARAASLGQVHRATALDGRALACKLQYPDMASAVEADLRQLKLAMGLYERYDRAVTTAEIHAEIADRLREELDYEREAAHMRLYGEILRGEPGVAVPAPLPELSTRRLLTMTWLDGAPILDVAKKAPLRERNEIALRMFRTWYLPFYHYGVIHGDPHLGNYTVDAGPDRQSARFRLHQDLSGLVRARRHRSVPRIAARRSRPRRPRLSELGVRQSVARDDRGAEPLGVICLWPAARRSRAADPGKARAGPTAPVWPKACTAISAGSAGSDRRASSSLWTAPRSGSARCSCTSRPRSTGTSCSTS